MKLSMKDLRELISGSTDVTAIAHPLDGKKVIAVLPYGFIFLGKMHDLGGRFRLTEASNIRFWVKRNGGLPELAEKGPINGDRIDPCGDVFFDNALFFYPIEY